MRQGDEEMQQLFILEGMLKRVVSNPQGREMILRFAAEGEMDTGRRLAPAHAGAPIVAVTKVPSSSPCRSGWSS